MPRFAFEAAASDGAIGRGVIDAPSRSIAAERIVAQGRTPLRIVEQHDAQAASPSGRGVLPRWGLASRRLVLLRELATLLDAGLTIERALRTMRGLVDSRQSKAEIGELLDGLHGGEPLSHAMARLDAMFPEWLRHLVAAGEASGRLPEVIARIAETETRKKDLAERAVSAMIYPVLLVVVMLAVLYMIFTVVVPRLEPLFAQSGEGLPWTTAALVATAHVFNAYGTWIGAGLIAASAAFLYALRRPGARLAIDRWLLKTRLLFDIPRRYHAAQFARNTAMLLDGGLPLNRALEIAQAALANSHVRRRLAVTAEKVRQGGVLRDGLEAADAFPRAMIELAAVGEETGRLGAMLKKAADLLDRDVQTTIDRLSALLLPTVTILLGIVVAMIMSGVVSGILAANEIAL